MAWDPPHHRRCLVLYPLQHIFGKEATADRGFHPAPPRHRPFRDRDPSLGPGAPESSERRVDAVQQWWELAYNGRCLYGRIAHCAEFDDGL